MNEFEKYGIFSRINTALAAEGLLFGGTTPRVVTAGQSSDVTIDGVDYKIEVHFGDGATAAQRARVAEIIATIDKQKRKPRKRADLRQAIDALSNKDFKDLVIELLVDKIGQDAGFAKRLGKTLDGDEVDNSVGVKAKQ